MFFVAVNAAAQDKPSTQLASPSCLVVQAAGSHSLRNMVLVGPIGGALISKQQYKVLATNSYPAKVGDKFHGNELDTIQKSGTKVVIVGKKVSKDDIAVACATVK